MSHLLVVSALELPRREVSFLQLLADASVPSIINGNLVIDSAPITESEEEPWYGWNGSDETSYNRRRGFQPDLPVLRIPHRAHSMSPPMLSPRMMREQSFIPDPNTPPLTVVGHCEPVVKNTSRPVTPANAEAVSGPPTQASHVRVVQIAVRCPSMTGKHPSISPSRGSKRRFDEVESDEASARPKRARSRQTPPPLEFDKDSSESPDIEEAFSNDEDPEEKVKRMVTAEGARLNGLENRVLAMFGVVPVYKQLPDKRWKCCYNGHVSQRIGRPVLDKSYRCNHIVKRRREIARHFIHHFRDERDAALKGTLTPRHMMTPGVGLIRLEQNLMELPNLRPQCELCKRHQARTDSLKRHLEVIHWKELGLLPPP